MSKNKKKSRDKHRTPLLSIIMPVFNERQYIEEIVARVLAVDIGKELIIVDDGSTDGTAGILDNLDASEQDITLLRHDRNRGKGAAIRTALEKASGKWVIIQDADLEYDPDEYHKLLEPALTDRADVVYGSRFLTEGPRRVLYFRHWMINRLLTIISNLLTDLALTDVETCYKLFSRDVLNALPLKEDRFGFETEVTARIARVKPRLRIYEVGISYSGRTYDEGKKIGILDGLRAFYTVFKYRFFK